jgi:hypothetical protein
MRGPSGILARLPEAARETTPDSGSLGVVGRTG